MGETHKPTVTFKEVERQHTETMHLGENLNGKDQCRKKCQNTRCFRLCGALCILGHVLAFTNRR